MTSRANPTEVEGILRSDPAVHACAALRRCGVHGELVVAYVVPTTDAWPIERLRVRLAGHEGVIIVPISQLPLTPEGALDCEALKKIPVIDGELLSRTETAVRSLPGVREAIALELRDSPPPGRLHFEDLMAPWDSAPRKVQHLTSKPRSLSPASSSPEAAVVHGGMLLDDGHLPGNLPEVLIRAAARFPEKTLTCIEIDGSEITQTYGELHDEARRIASGLIARGLTAGGVIVLQIERIRNFWHAFWGCLVAGLVPVPLGLALNAEKKSLSASRLRAVWEWLGRPSVLTDCPSGMPSPDGISGESLIFLEPLRANSTVAPPSGAGISDLALILFTSGSTGTPKGVMQTHGALIRFCAGATQLNRLDSEGTSLNWMPLEHIGALADFHLRSIFIGASQVHVATERILASPVRWLELIDRHGAQVSWAPNFAFGLVNDRANDLSTSKIDLSSVKLLFNAGEAVVARTARRFMKMLAPCGLKGDVMRPTWGMSETCSGALYGTLNVEATSDGDQAVDVGAPIPGLSFRIVDNHNHVLLEGSTGELQVRGDTVTAGYFKDQEANERAFAGDRWFKTGDLAVIRRGHVAIVGRAKDVIIVNGANYQPHDFESAVEELFGVVPSSVAVCSVQDAGDDTENLVVFFGSDLRSDAELERLIHEVRGLISFRFGASPKYILPCDPALIPRSAIGKIQRSELRRRLAEGRFDGNRRRVDILLKRPNTIPSWFFEAFWRPCLHRMPLESPDPVLIFDEGLGLGEGVLRESKRAGRASMAVGRGARFRQLDETTFEIDPECANDYRRVLEVFIRRHGPVLSILHLWSCDSAPGDTIEKKFESARISGWGSLLLLYQALRPVLPKDSLQRWWIVSAGAQAVGPFSDDSLGFSLVPGIVKSFGAETQRLRVRHVDLDPDWRTRQREESVQCISKELHCDDEAEVVYREGARLCPRLKRQIPGLFRPPSPRLSRGGVCLLTGGLGGIGRLLAAHLLKKYECRLVVIGRTVVSETHVSNQEETAGMSGNHGRTISRLKALPGSIEYHSIDVCDLAGLSRVVGSACARFGGQLDAVFHLAGTYEERSISEESPVELARHLRPKLSGTMALAGLLQRYPGALFVGFSSVSSFFGGASIGGYVAGNRFLEWFCRHRESEIPGRTACVAWPRWEGAGIGSGRTNAGVLEGFGYRSITEVQGLASLEAVLQNNLVYSAVGLDDMRQNVGRFIEETSPRTVSRRVVVAYTGHASQSQRESLGLFDRFGTALQPDFIKLAELASGADGEIDRKALIEELSHDARAGCAAQPPRTYEETRMAAIWTKLLGLEQGRLGVTEDFFRLGGNSLLAVELMAAVETEFGVSFPMVTLLKASTVEQFCAFLSKTVRSGAEKPPLSVEGKRN